MLGLVLSLISALPGAAAPTATAATTCVDDPSRMTVVATVSLADAWDDVDAADRDADAEPARYATPAAIDCRVPVVSPLLLTLVGSCDGVTLTDTSYRMSRSAENEAPQGRYLPVRQDASARARVTVCNGVPSPSGAWLSPPTSQPAALFALPSDPRFAASMVAYAQQVPPLSAQGRRLERPPRV